MSEPETGKLAVDRPGGSVLSRRSLLRRAGASAVAVLGSPALLAACTGGPQGAAPTLAPGGTAPTSAGPLRSITLGMPVAPDINPAKMSSWAFSYGTFASPAYAPILHMKPDGSFDAALATKWQFLPTGGAPNREFEFTLRRDARFSDGELVNAKAVVGWLDYFSKAQGPYANWLGPDPAFEAADEWTVRVHLKVPTPLLPWYLSDAHNWGLVASPRAVANPTLFTNETFGAGPYVLDPSQSVKGDHYTFVPNANHHDKSSVRFKEINFKIISVPSSMLQSMQSGQLDAGYGDPTTLAAAESSGLRVAAAPNAQMLMVMNPQRAPQFADVRVRQALNYAVDRRAIAEAIAGKHGAGTSEFLTTDAEAGLRNYYGYDPARARSLLGAAGYANGFKMDFLSRPADQGAVGPTLTQAVAKYLEAVGIQTNIIVPPASAAWTTARGSAPLYTTPASLAPTPTRWSVYVEPGKAAFGGYFDDPKMVELFNLGLSEPNPTASWKKMWELITKEAYFVPLHTYSQGWYVAKGIGGVNYTVERFGTVLVPELHWT
jgi:peptide/nickel transport system substrate-binding protein